MVVATRRELTVVALCVATCLVVVGCEQPQVDAVTGLQPPPPAAPAPPPPAPPIAEPVVEEPSLAPQTPPEPVDQEPDAPPPSEAEEPAEDTLQEPLTPQQAKEFFEQLGARVLYISEDGAVKAYLNRSQVEDEHLRFLKYLPKLGVVNLSGRPISDDGLVHLHEIASLQRIYLAGTNVSDQAVEELQAAIPEGKILK